MAERPLLDESRVLREHIRVLSAKLVAVEDGTAGLLRRNGSVSTKELAEHLGIGISSASTKLSRLYDARLVDRTRLHGDATRRFLYRPAAAMKRKGL